MSSNPKQQSHRYAQFLGEVDEDDDEGELGARRAHDATAEPSEKLVNKDMNWLSHKATGPGVPVQKQMSRELHEESIFEESTRAAGARPSKQSLQEAPMNSSQLDFISKYGVLVDPPTTSRTQEGARISMVEQNYFEGQYFSAEMYRRWTRMKFQDKMKMKIEKILQERTAVDGYIKEMEERQRQRLASEEEQFRRLSLAQ